MGSPTIGVIFVISSEARNLMKLKIYNKAHVAALPLS